MDQLPLSESKRHIIEALIFASDEPLTARQIMVILGAAENSGPRLRVKEDEVYGINDLSELPKPREIEEIMADQGLEMEKEILKRMGKTDEEIEEQLGKTVVGEDGELRELPDNSDNPGSGGEGDDEGKTHL